MNRIAILLLALSLPAHAATLHVSPDGSGADGLTWPTAFPTLGEAIVASSTEDEIWMASGTYTENLQVVRPITILGGFAGNENPAEREERNPEVNPTIIDGNRLGPVVTVRGSTTLDGVTVQNGLANDGSGINALHSDLTLRRVKVMENGESGNRGGGVYIDQGNLVVDECVLSSNSANGNGGGLFARGSTVRLVATIFQENISRSWGSGAFIIESMADISNSKFLANGAKFVSRFGGALSVDSSHMTIVDSVLDGNSGGGGGGVLLNKSTSTFSTCRISNNDGTGAGGGIYANAGSTYTIDRC
ncbi:MAG: DUF1565 domain-containing protein, partial [Candidatus Omnitrophica bacterium]|nr:DUF1565 domain-containing protein [Candidatus Omnitrophota bacterium]